MGWEIALIDMLIVHVFSVSSSLYSALLLHSITTVPTRMSSSVFSSIYLVSSFILLVLWSFPPAIFLTLSHSSLPLVCLIILPFFTLPPNCFTAFANLPPFLSVLLLFAYSFIHSLLNSRGHLSKIICWISDAIRFVPICTATSRKCANLVSSQLPFHTIRRRYDLWEAVIKNIVIFLFKC